MRKTATYLVVIGKTTSGYSAHCPDVPGCAAVGLTVEEVLKNMRAALELHFEGLREDGEPMPRPGGAAAYRQLLKDLDVESSLLGHVQLETPRIMA